MSGHLCTKCGWLEAVLPCVWVLDEVVVLLHFQCRGEMGNIVRLVGWQGAGGVGRFKVLRGGHG